MEFNNDSESNVRVSDTRNKNNVRDNNFRNQHANAIHKKRSITPT